MAENRNIVPADGILGDMKVTLDVPVSSVASLVVGCALVFVAYFLTRKYLS